jgi:hypothetical protein
VVDAMKKAALGGGVHFVTAQEAIYDSVDPFTGNRLPINLRVTQVTDAGVASILKAFSAVSATPPHGHEKGRKPAPYDA